jgi:RNA polymerase sigma-70 factor, ECF subfamily
MDAALALASVVERARSGDRLAFADLHARFGHAVFLFLAGLLRRREDAEDAWQVAFLSAWRHLPRLRQAERFSPWLFHIARNAARDVAARRRRWPDALPPGDDLLVAPVAPVAAPRDDATTDSVASLVAGLEPETRALVLLRAVEGWSAEDVGAALSFSVATVRRRYARALALLKARVEARIGTEGRTSHV